MTTIISTTKYHNCNIYALESWPALLAVTLQQNKTTICISRTIANYYSQQQPPYTSKLINSLLPVKFWNTSRSRALQLADFQPMLVQVSLLSKGSTTTLTDKRLGGTLMNKGVRTKVRLVGKGPLTTRKHALIRSFAGVRAHVALEQPGALEFLVTHRTATVLLRVRGKVRVIRRQHRENTAASRAGVRIRLVNVRWCCLQCLSSSYLLGNCVATITVQPVLTL